MTSRKAAPLALVVDDESDYSEVVSTWLTRAGFDVIFCSNGWDGIAQARASHPDLVVSDIVMPGGIDGWDMAYLLKMSSSSASVILMTGFSRKIIEKKRELPANVIGFLEKPFRESDLLAVIRQRPAAGDGTASAS